VSIENSEGVEMKVKFVSAKFEYSGFDVGTEYEVFGERESVYPGAWYGVVNSIGIPTWINVGGEDAFGTWEIVSE